MAFNFEALTEATSGAVGGLLSTSILYPLDTCKTKYQAEVRAGDSRKYGSLFDVLREAVATRQILSLYQGLGTKNLQSVISQFIYFYSYSYFKHLYLRKSKKKTLGTGANLIVAASAGACTAVLTQPLDTASARMQTSTFGKSKGLWEILGEGSWRQAFDGIGASLVLTSNPAIQYTAFEQLKVRLIRRQKLERLANGKIGATVDSAKLAAEYSPVVLSALSAFILGALSKTVATVVTYPAIRCKVMIQATESEEDKQQRLNGDYQERPPKKMLDALRIIWHKEGILGFYKGLQAQILKTILSAALMLMIKEKTSKGTWLVMMALRSWWQVFSRKRLKQI